MHIIEKHNDKNLSVIREVRIMKEQYPFSLKPLPYTYDSLEPYISQRTMRVHHTRLHASYVRDLNEEIKEKPEYLGLSLCEIYSKAEQKKDKTSEKIRHLCAAVYNHNLFFAILAPTYDNAIRSPQGNLARAIRREYGSEERFMLTLRDEALALRGSGWVFLCKDNDDIPRIISAKNHSIPSPDVYSPILILDCFEHAFFLDYLDKKKDYYENYFRLINWKLAELLWTSSIVYK